MHELWGRLLRPQENSKIRLLQRPLGAADSGRGQPPAWAKQAVFTPVTREEEGEKGSPSKAPNFSAAPGRERPARSCGQVEAEGQGEPAAAGEVTTTLTSPAGAWGGKGGSCTLRAPPPASPHPPRKRAEPKPGARRPAEPAPPRSARLRGRQVPPAPARVWRVGWVPSPSSPQA